ncbi:MAG: CoA transferase [Actinomycetia bacterium]|nr:CoA transferase [Actinomycetes bacterium]
MRPLAGLAVAVAGDHPALWWASTVLAWLGADVGVNFGEADLVLGCGAGPVGRVGRVGLLPELPDGSGFTAAPGGLSAAAAVTGLHVAAAACLAVWARETGQADGVTVAVSAYRAALGLVQPLLAGAPSRRSPWLAYYAGADGIVGVFCPTPRDVADLVVMAELPAYPGGVGDDEPRRRAWEAALAAWVRRWPVERLAAEAQAWRLPWAPVRPPPARPAPPWTVVGVGPPGDAPGAGSRRTAWLDGLVVVDLTAVWAGPQVTRWLAMLGARVVKVESPLRPDGYRAAGGRVFANLNAGKAVRRLHLGRPPDDVAFARLLAGAHLLVDNLSPRVLPNLGWDDARLWQVRPGLVHVALPAFGGTGPERYWIGYGPTVEAAGGLAWAAGVRPGERAGPTVADPLAAAWGLVGVLAACLEARRRGRGVAVEVRQVDGLGALVAAGLTAGGLAAPGWEDPAAMAQRRALAARCAAIDPATGAVRPPWGIHGGHRAAARRLLPE